MKINNLKQLKHKLTMTVVSSFLLSLFFLLLMSFVFYKIYFNYKKTNDLREIITANQLFQSSLSEQLSIIANSPEFISYLRSGKLSRELMNVDLLTLLSSLKTPSIEGMEINKKEEGNIFVSGKTSPYYITMNLCYLDTKLDNNNGDCSNYTWTLFFKKEEYLKSLISINDAIYTCTSKNCYRVKLLGNKKFGSFYIKSASELNYEIGLRNKRWYSFIYINLLFLLTIIILAVLNQRKIKFLVDKYIAGPLEKITENLKSGKLIKNGNIYALDEVIYLSNQIEIFKKNEQSAKIGQIASQVVHDIRSPVAAILMLANQCQELPEEPRVSLREAANRIQDIANNLLTYNTNKSENISINDMSLFLASTAILSVISEKKILCRETHINITHDFSDESSFLFIKANLSDFKRVIANLINNAIEAISYEGSIIVKLSSDLENVYIDIHDSGRGMSNAMLKNIQEGCIESNKENGFGLGLKHAKAFLSSVNGRLDIKSTEKQGTQVKLLLKKQKQPSWIADEITFFNDTIIVILDDDNSIHTAWNGFFQQTLKDNPLLQLIHFIDGKKCIEYIKNLSEKEFKKVLLLTDYELIKQEMNGINVIEMTTLPRAILVTSHYDNKEIIKQAILLNTKMLPKILVTEVKQKIIEKKEEKQSLAELIILEDNIEYAKTVSYLLKYREKRADIYHDSFSLLDNIDLYNKLTTKICLDFDLSSLINGIELAEKLYQKGFKLLYIASGYSFKQAELPSYLQLLPDKKAILNL